MKFVLSTFGCKTSEMLELAKTADRCGWEGISFSDHLVNFEQINTPYPYTEDGARRWEMFTEFPDPFVVIGAIAGCTERLRFTHNLFVLPIRHPFAVAKAVATACVISQNRLTLAVGLGWSKDEFETMGENFGNRGKRADEMIEIMRKLWSGELVEHNGKHYQFPPLEASPAPSEQPPIWVGGISDFALRRSARLADGWVSDLQSGAEIIACIDKVRAYREELGRGAEFEVMATPNDAFGLDDWRRLRAHGVTHILMAPWMIYFGDKDAKDISTEEKTISIERFATEYIDPLNEEFGL